MLRSNFIRLRLMICMGMGLQAVTAMAEAPEYSLMLAQNSKPKRTHSGRIIEEERTTAGSSEVMRQDKKGYAFGEVIGFTPIVSLGVGGGMYLDPDTIIDGSYTHGSASLIGISVVIDTIAARYKSFVGNSFYWRAGAMYRKIEFDDSGLAEAFGVGELSIKSSATSFGPEIAIGNQWQWENFTLGCDWIGYFLPVASSVSVSANPGVTQTTYDDEKKSMERLGKAGNGELLRFYLGASF